MRNVGVLAAIAICLLGADASAAERRLLILPLAASDDIPEGARSALDSAVRTQVDKAAKDRAYEVVPLDRVKGLQKELEGCADADCRAASARRVKATHVLAGRIALRNKKTAKAGGAASSGASTSGAALSLNRPKDLKKDAPIRIDVTRPQGFVFRPQGRDDRSSSGGYRVWLWLEDVSAADFVDAAKLEGDVPFLTGRLRETVDDLLEAGAPREEAIRSRLVRTAEGYTRAGRDKDAIRTLRRAINVNPLHPAAVKLQLDVVRRFTLAHDLEGEATAIGELLELYGPSSAWARSGIGGQKVQGEVSSAVKAAVFDHATRCLAFSQGNLKTEGDKAPQVSPERARTLARESFANFAAGFPLDDNAEEALFFEGEIAFEEERFDEAQRAYGEVAARESGKRRADAAAARLYALEKILKAKAGSAGYAAFPPSGKRGARQALPAEAQAFVDATERLLQVGSFKSAAPAFAYRTGEVLLSYGDKAQAEKWFKRVADRYPESEAGKLAKSKLEGESAPPAAAQ